jgi:hypothetical protein
MSVAATVWEAAVLSDLWPLNTQLEQTEIFVDTSAVSFTPDLCSPSQNAVEH